MASSSSSASAPVSSSQSWSYDVFLSFRGEDTRKTFVDHLYAALDQSGVHTYKDDITLPRGESISPALLKAIEESQIAVVIFSQNYANSTWCLDELTHIMKCRANKKQIVMPIFYDVEPWEVRYQQRTYKEAFDKHELENKKKVETWGQAVASDPCGWLCAPLQTYRKYREASYKQEIENKEKVDTWRKALVEASSISGWETNQIANGHEATGIKQIVSEISLSLKPVTSGANEKLIGMRDRLQALKSELQIEAGGVRMVGIWGVGGGGKTTLANSIYDKISSLFDGACFVNNVREESRKKGLEKLQEVMLKGIFKQKHVGMDRLRHKKVLIVLDDVDHLDQLEALVGSHAWFGDGSRIIMTTRDEHLLKAHGVDVIHELRLLNHDEAIKLFRKHAHKDNTPTKDFEQLSKEVVSYAGGLPLALTVLGSFLCGRNASQWRSALDRLKEIPHKNIIGILRISFDGLEEVEKELFLDIACLFRGEKKDRTKKVFDACGFHPDIGVEVLRQKALIVIDEDGYFGMHDLVQEMAHHIVRGEHPNNPEKHSRVWKKKDVRIIFDMAATMKLDNIEAIDHEYLSYEESQRFLQVAGNMNKLRWIHLDVFDSIEQYNEESGENNVVRLPENFPPPQLCCLYLEGCFPHKQLWEGYKHLPNLTHMELYASPNLIKIPDFAGLPNLQTCILCDCPYLEEIHPSIGRLKRLVLLSVGICPRLKMFPSITRTKKLETLVFHGCEQLVIISEIHPSPHLCRRVWFVHNALRKLDLSDCCLKDDEISSDVWELPNLEQLNLEGNPLISRLDFSILRLPRLKRLYVSKCCNLVELSELPSSIAVVHADHCDSLESFGDISNCKWLWEVSLVGKNKLDQLCVDTFIHSMLQENASKDHFMSAAIQHQLPSRFVCRLSGGNTFRLQLPDDWYNDFCGFLICILTNMMYPSVSISIKKEEPPFDLSQQESDEAMEPIYDGHVTCLGYVPFSSTRHTTLFTSSYNTISFTIRNFLIDHGISDERNYGGIELIPRKSKSDEVHATDSSEFWDGKFSTFTIRQCDSQSPVEITWIPYDR